MLTQGKRDVIALSYEEATFRRSTDTKSNEPEE